MTPASLGVRPISRVRSAKRDDATAPSCDRRNAVRFDRPGVAEFMDPEYILDRIIL
jgi:hypothetical protein